MEETFAEVSFDFKQPEKENLLVIAPSYSNAINKISEVSHFNKTYYIDLRHIIKILMEKHLIQKSFVRKIKSVNSYS